MPSGRVKSISTCGLARPVAQVAGDRDAAGLAQEGGGVLAQARGSPAHDRGRRPARGRPAPATASISMRPMRPDAPAMAIRDGGSSAAWAAGGRPAAGQCAIARPGGARRALRLRTGAGSGLAAAGVPSARASGSLPGTFSAVDRVRRIPVRLGRTSAPSMLLTACSPSKVTTDLALLRLRCPGGGS